VLPPAPGAFHHGAGRALEQFDMAAGVERLTVAADQLRLVIESVALAGGPGHEHLHDALGFRGMVQSAVQLGPWRVGEQAVVAEQPGHGDAAEPAAGLPEEVAAGADW